MKRIIRFFIFLAFVCFLGRFGLFKVHGQVVIEDEIKENLEINLADCLIFDTLNEDKIFVFENYLYYGYQDTLNKLDEAYLTHLFINDTLYLATQNNLYKIVRGRIDKKVAIDVTINSLYYQDYLYAAGSLNDKALIKEYDLNLKEQRSFVLQDDVNTNINFLIKENNDFYALIERQHFSPNSIFKNIGNYFDTKTCLIKLDKRFNILKVLYLNVEAKDEIPSSLIIKDNQIYFSINVKEYNLSYYYQTDLNLSTLKLIKNNELMDTIMLDYNGDFIGFSFDHFLKMDAKDDYYDFDIKNPLNVMIQDDELQVYTKDDNSIKLYHISEYHINYIKDFQVGYNYGNYDFTQDLNHTKAIDISSYFSSVEVKANENFTFNKSAGSYPLELVAKFKRMEDLNFTTNIVIAKYINIENNHAYPNGTMLNFLGQATLDGEKITSGMLLKEEGEHIIKLADNQNNVDEYHIFIVKDYYLSNEYVTDVDYYVKQNTDFLIPFLFEGNIQQIYVNNQETPFVKENDTILLSFKGVSASGIKKYLINKVVTDDNVYLINQEFSVYFLKAKPIIEIVEDESVELSLNLKITDDDKALTFLKIIDGENVAMNFLKDGLYDLKDGNIKIMLCYDLGDGIKDVEILELDVTFKDGKEMLEILVDKTVVIKNIQLKFKSKAFQKINKLSVSGQILSYDYASKDNYVNLFVSIGLTLFVVTAVILFIVFKNIRRKRNSASQLLENNSK